MDNRSLHEMMGNPINKEGIAEEIRKQNTPEGQRRNFKRLFAHHKSLISDRDYHAFKIGWGDLDWMGNKKFIGGLIDNGRWCVEKYIAGAQFGGSRSLEIIAGSVNMTSEELVSHLGKTVLDVGPGNSSFEADMKKIDSTVRIVSADVNVANLRYRRDLSERALLRNNQLRLEDGSFDGIIASFSFPMYQERPEDIPVVFDELLRVLRKGGELVIYPVNSYSGLVNDRVARTVELSKPGLRSGSNFSGERWCLLANLIDIATAEKIMELKGSGAYEIALGISLKNESSITDLTLKNACPDILVVKKL